MIDELLRIGRLREQLCMGVSFREGVRAPGLEFLRAEPPDEPDDQQRHDRSR
jgi:hypothetical protein